MEEWLIYSIFASIAVGIFGFLQKVESESDLNRNSFIFYSHIGMILLPVIYVLSRGDTFDFNMKIFGYALVLNVIYVLIIKFRLKSLEYLDSSSYFINYRIFSSILLIVLGQIIFGEKISFNEYLGILIGFLIFYLLIEKKSNAQSYRGLLKGFLYLGIGVIGVSTIWILQKDFVLLELDFMAYIFMSGIVGSLVTLALKGKKDSLRDVLLIQGKKNILFLMFSGIIFPMGLYLNMQAVGSGGDVAIVYKIVSYSLFIPIILSIIFYKEKVTWKKLLAFILTVASIGLFV